MYSGSNAEADAVVAVARIVGVPVVAAQVVRIGVIPASAAFTAVGAAYYCSPLKKFLHFKNLPKTLT